ncbi:hypothetical protein [Agrobacterium tumefaciens]|uniref:hypothetical protein n=1 Tax=Agrobacterium tumefaciens TaxID=358 RepID=UPI0015745189|nr:hypothetical protein [Agrobacterium tumefaciens]WCJ61875.1 hypothetical protein G6M15_10590 [Agrobacterium tumefaciens]
MSKKFHAVTLQRFTSTGKLGIALLLAGPILSGVGYNWLVVEMSRPYAGSPIGPALCMLIGSLGFVGSLPLMLIGREHHQTITETIEKPGEKGLWS